MREKGEIKSISNLSNRQQCIRRKQWRKDSRNYRKRKSLQQAKETPEAEETHVGSRGSPRIQSGRKAAKHTYSSLRYKLQSMIAKSLKQARKIENLRKENYRLKFKDKSKCSLSPATKIAFLIQIQYNPPANAIKNIIQNDYVVIKLSGKKSVRFYVGVIISQDAFDEYTAKFMRKCGKDKFTFPENDDIAEVGWSNIVNVLSQLKTKGNNMYLMKT
ncbi:hypothetical protein AVEN_235391-1 [Araneus ventricosus]|uniref:Uncharacterized protein n=1 Tax=Araneus ventricosus TaxID=182803 RepID=A0A4Y2A3L8_ARAVE|nr:hypothetical protein AVEN_235391-1 [Araneus ventricosus]